MGNPCGKILAGKSCGKFLWEILVGKSCRKFLWQNLAGKSLQEILAGIPCAKFLPGNAVDNLVGNLIEILWKKF